MSGRAHVINGNQKFLDHKSSSVSSLECVHTLCDIEEMLEVQKIEAPTIQMSKLSTASNHETRNKAMEHIPNPQIHTVQHTFILFLKLSCVWNPQ